MSSLNLNSLQVAATNMQNVNNVKLPNANQTPASSLEYLYQAISLIETKNQLTSNVLNNANSNINNNQIQQQQKSIQANFHNDYSANLINENKKRIIGNLIFQQQQQQQQQQNQHQNLANNENLRFMNLNTNNKNLNNKSKNQPEMILNCSCCNNPNKLGLNQTYLSQNNQNTNVKVNKPSKKEDKRISSLINKQIQLEQQQLQAQKDQKHTPPSRLEKAKQLARKINSCDYPHSCSNSSLSSTSSSPIYLYPSSSSNSPFSAFYPPQGTVPINSNYYPIDVLYTLLPLYLNPYLNKQPINNCATKNNNNNNQSNEQIQNLVNLINSISTFQQQQQKQSQFNSHNINDLGHLNHQLINNNFVLYPIPSQAYQQQQQQQQQQHQNQQANTSLNTTILNQNALPSLSVSPISSISSISSKSSTRSSFASYSSSKAPKSRNLLNKSKQVDIIENFDVNSKVEEHFKRSLGNKYFNFIETEQKSNKRLKLDENNNYITQEEKNCKSPDLKLLKKDENSFESNEDDIQSQNDFSAASSASLDDHYEANIEPVSPCSPCSVKSTYSCQDSSTPGLNINEFSDDSSASKLKTDFNSVQMKKKNDIVDTHFSKALGEDIWNRIKEKIKFGNSFDNPSEICSSLSTSVKL